MTENTTKKDVLTVRVFITGCNEVKGGNATARMITFDGDCDCENFKGKILAGGVDTQREYKCAPFSLSARYMLEGTDREGKPCKIFIENNGTLVNGEMLTQPKITTDSEALAYLESASLEGTVEGWEKGVIIHIYEK